jgi:hypothetical protein
MLKEYDIAIIFWEDHYSVVSSTLPENIDDVTPTLSVGLIIEETDKALVLAHDIEKYTERDDLTYTVILKNAVVGKKVYGKIKIEEPRR